MLTYVINSKIATEKEMTSVLCGRERLLTSVVNRESSDGFNRQYVVVWNSDSIKDEFVVSFMDDETEKVTTMRATFSDKVRIVVTTGSAVHYMDYEIPSEEKLINILRTFF